LLIQIVNIFATYIVCIYIYIKVEVTLRLTVSQSVSQYVSMSWYRAPLWDLRPDITSCRNVVVWNLRSCIYWAPSLTRGRVSKSKLLYDWQSVCLGIEHPCGICDQILLPVGMLLYEICGLVSVGRPLWREDGSAIRSVLTLSFCIVHKARI
jgi:hypothetical protein